MKTIDFKKAWIALLFVPICLSSCSEDILPGISGYGDVVSQSFMLDDFTGFSNSIAADVYVTQGDEQEVIIKGQQNIIDNILMDHVDNGFWRIKNDKMVRNAKQVKIYITLPTLDKVIVAGSGKIVGETSFTDLNDLELRISGSGSIQLDFMCNKLESVITGSGNFDLSGETKTMDGAISGSGSFRGYDLEIERAEFSITGSGDGQLSVAEHLRATISGSGSVYYRGTPEMDIHISGSGNVKRDR